jgi:hypothetical protein
MRPFLFVPFERLAAWLDAGCAAALWPFGRALLACSRAIPDIAAPVLFG